MRPCGFELVLRYRWWRFASIRAEETASAVARGDVVEAELASCTVAVDVVIAAIAEFEPGFHAVTPSDKQHMIGEVIAANRKLETLLIRVVADAGITRNGYERAEFWVYTRDAELAIEARIGRASPIDERATVPVCTELIDDGWTQIVEPCARHVVVAVLASAGEWIGGLDRPGAVFEDCFRCWPAAGRRYGRRH